MSARLYVGTCGWSYDDWKESFYAGVPRARWLSHYASCFSAVEVNASYYRLQRIDTYRKWYEATPPGFRFAIKANRYVTASRRLREPRQSIALERERARGLGEKLSVVLWQCPATFHKNLRRLEAFAKALGTWRDVRHAVEFRHVSWFDADVLQCLRDHNLTSCQSDAADWPLWDAVSTDLVYVRLHGHTRTYASAYNGKSLMRWAARVRHWLGEDREVHVYFDNTYAGKAVKNAQRLCMLMDAVAQP